MNLKQINKFFNTDNNVTNLFRISFVILVFYAAYWIFLKYDEVYHLALNDTDDFMRYHQYTQWIKNGNWYLQPLAQFNSGDGQIIHWSRLADIPLVIVSLLAYIFVDWHTAFTIANIITPLFYLLIFVFLIVLITYKLFDMETAKISMILPFLSPITSRFLPGSIDHHNLQFVLLAAFILYLPLINFNKLNRKAFFSALAMSCSLWVGLENIYTFVTVLLVLTVLGIYKNRIYLYFCEKFCLYSIVFIMILLILNRPVTEFFYTHYDALSFPFLLCFISAYIFCKVLNFLADRYFLYKFFIYLVLVCVLYFPIILIYPELVLGGYSNYPILLKEIWLNNVTEVISIVEYIFDDFKNIAFILSVLPAILSPLFFRTKPNVEKYWILYLAFGINFLLACFWQIRMFQAALVCAIPLQAYICLELRKKLTSIILKTVILFLSFPTVMLVIIFAIFGKTEGNRIEEKYDNKYNSYYISAVNLLNKNKVYKYNILNTIDLGPAIIASTDNNIIAAPYHRNIRGNTEMILFFRSESNEAREILDRNNIDYILIDEKGSNTFKGNMMSKLMDNENLPDWLKFIDSSTHVKLYQYIRE